jgi:hypothetical protein
MATSYSVRDDAAIKERLFKSDDIQVHTLQRNSSPLSQGAPLTSRLPPKTLPQRSKIHNFLLHLMVAVVASCALSGAIAYGVTGYWYHSTQLTSDFLDNFCDKQTASASEQRFVIDIRFGGGFSFAQAKLIDVAWDPVIGQGGRSLHRWLLYHYIVSDALVWTMERSAVPYHYYTNLYFSTISVQSLWSLGRMIARRRGWRTIISTFLWIIFAIRHLLVSPTIWSAATGYLSTSTRKYLMLDQSLVPLNSEYLAMC